MHMICGQTPATNLPQGTVTFIVIWGLLLARKKTNMLSFNGVAFKAVASFSWRPFFWLVSWSLSSMNTGYKGGRRGRGTFSHQMILDPSPSPSMYQVTLAQEQLSIGFSFLSIQVQPLALDLLFLCDLCSQGVDISNDSCVDHVKKGVVDEVAVN